MIRNIVALISTVFLATVAQAQLSTTEGTTGYARVAIQKAFAGSIHSLVPGSITLNKVSGVADRVLKLVDSETEIYEVSFLVQDSRKARFAGRIHMIMSVRSNSSEDNNTTFRVQDPITRKALRVQLFDGSRGGPWVDPIDSNVTEKDVKLTQVP